jgi:hypothetical protein
MLQTSFCIDQSRVRSRYEAVMFPATYSSLSMNVVLAHRCCIDCTSHAVHFVDSKRALLSPRERKTVELEQISKTLL